MAAMAGEGKLVAIIGDEDTVTGFLLAGTGEVDVKKNANFLVVSPSEPPRPAAPSSPFPAPPSSGPAA